jgi:hypothetical protein
LLQRKEEEFYKRQADNSKAQQEHEMKVESIQQQMHAEQVEMDHLKLDQERYIAELNNETKIQVAEIGVYSRQENLDQNANGIPDPSEIADNALKQQELGSKMFLEQSKLGNDRSKHDALLAQKDKESRLKNELENKKIQAIRVQNQSQEKIAAASNKLKEKEMKNKVEIEKMKLAAARAKAAKTKK